MILTSSNEFLQCSCGYRPFRREYDPEELIACPIILGFKGVAGDAMPVPGGTIYAKELSERTNP
jgi:hypothetical protein